MFKKIIVGIVIVLSILFFSWHIGFAEYLGSDGGVVNSVTSCNTGYHLDTLTNSCVLTLDSTTNSTTSCATGYYYDTVYNKCLLAPASETTPSTSTTNIVLVPTILFSASSYEVYAGQPVTFSWKSEDTTGCVAQGGWDGSREISGTFQKYIYQSAIFGLTCSGTGGNISSSVSIRAKEIPICSVGYVFNLSKGACVPDQNYCASGTLWNATTNTCIIPETITSTTTSTSTNTSAETKIYPTCEYGYVWDISLNKCVSATVPTFNTTVAPEIKIAPLPTITAAPKITGTMSIITGRGHADDGGRISGKIYIRIKMSEKVDKVRLILANEKGKRIFGEKEGLMRMEEGEGTQWQLVWDTHQIPNDTYKIVLQIAPNGDTFLDSDSLTVVVSNDIQTNIPPTETAHTTTSPAVQQVSNSIVVNYQTCTTKEECLKLCMSDKNTVAQCKEFRMKIIAKDERLIRSLTETVKEDTLRQILSTTTEDVLRPGGMRTVSDVNAYCSNPDHDAECKNFLMKEKIIDEKVFIEKQKVVEEKRQEAKQMLVERVGTRVFEDSDNDGISDYDENNIYHTNPNNSDTDKDGVKDGDELLAGTDPLVFNKKGLAENKPTTALSATSTGNQPAILVATPVVEVGSTTIMVKGHIAYENPKVVGSEAAAFLVAQKVSVVEKEKQASGEEKIKKMEFKGKALPNSFVTVYVFSTPIVVTVKTDANGNWSYVLDKELENGKHEVYVAMTDNIGKIVAKSKPLPFVQEAAAVTTDLATLPPPILTVDEVKPSIVDQTYLIMIGILIVAIIGGTLVLTAVKNRRREE